MVHACACMPSACQACHDDDDKSSINRGAGVASGSGRAALSVAPVESQARVICPLPVYDTWATSLYM